MFKKNFSRGMLGLMLQIVIFELKICVLDSSKTIIMDTKK